MASENSSGVKPEAMKAEGMGKRRKVWMAEEKEDRSAESRGTVERE